MSKLSMTRLAVAVGGLGMSLAAGVGVASAQPDLGLAVNTTCSYPQLVSALNAQSPEAGAAFDKQPMLKAGLQQFLASGPAQRQQMASRIAAAPWAQPYLGSIQQAFSTCQNF
ncbi:hemophore-related protein [Mycolicibacterium tusciae]|uniref:Hemophore-related protein n=1 Tax=Mycolicibacterium tusciae TaxID=75922 RepID=A0A1X0JD76_9MYCO|nr:hemophore-related protein [Mycolicibacterium tusciae]ORB60640.1 hemophore-related protein [Mycolicibacterium tusciae]